MRQFIRSANNYSFSTASARHVVVNDKPSLTRQAEAVDADINVIVRRFGVTGVLPSVPVPPTYADFGDVFDFQSAANLVRQSVESFQALDVEVRSRFGHDPKRFVDFCSAVDDKGNLLNLSEMRKMGLALPEAPPPTVPPPMKVEVVNPPTPK